MPAVWATQQQEEETPQIIPSSSPEDTGQQQLAFLLALQQQLLRNLGQGDQTLSQQVIRPGEGNALIDQFYRRVTLPNSGKTIQKHLNRAHQGPPSKETSQRQNGSGSSSQPQSAVMPPQTIGELVLTLMHRLLAWVRDGGDANGDGQSDLTDINDVRNNFPSPAEMDVSKKVMGMLMRMVQAGVDVTGDGTWSLDDIDFIRNLPTREDPSTEDPPDPDPEDDLPAALNSYLGALRSSLGGGYVVVASLLDADTAKWRIRIRKQGTLSEYASFESLTYRVLVGESDITLLPASLTLHYVGLALEPQGRLLWEALSGTEYQRVVILSGVRILDVREDAAGEQTVFLKMNGEDWKAYRNSEGKAVLEALPGLFEQNLDYLNAGWPEMLARLAQRYGWVYSWETGEWDYDPAQGTIPSFVLDANDAAYHMAYELDVLAEVAIKTHDLEKIGILAKFYLSYLYGPESPFMTLAQVKERILEAKAFLDELPRLTGVSNAELLASLSISDLANRHHLTLPALLLGLRDVNMTIGYLQSTHLRKLMTDVFGHPGDPERGATREGVSESEIFLEEFLRQHPQYHSQTTLGTIRHDNRELVLPDFISRFGNGATVQYIRETMDFWVRRFRSGIDNPYTDADDGRYILPYLSGEYGSTDVDHPKSVTQLMFAAVKLMVEIGKMTSSEKSQHPEFVEFTQKVSNYLLRDLIFPTIFEQYEIRYPTVMGDDRPYTRWEWWSKVMTMTPQEMQALPDGRAVAGRDWEFFWVPAILTGLLGVHNLNSGLVAMTAAEVIQAKEMVTLLIGLLDKQTFRSTVTFPDGSVVTVGNFQEHLWLQDLWVPDDSEGNFDMLHFSNRFPRASAMIRANLADAGLGHLLPAFESWMTVVINQLVFEDTTWVQIPGTDIWAPLFNNYIGDNARYRDGHPSSPDGFGPYELSFAVADNWAFLADFHPELWRILHRLEEIARSTDPNVWAWIQSWYKSLHRTNSSGRRELYWNVYYGLLAGWGG